MPNALISRPVTLGRRIAAALISGFAVAAVTHLATVLIYFVANGAATANLVPISDFFAASSLALFVVYSLAAFLGANRSWPIAFAAGAISGVIATVLGTTYGIITSGTAWTAEATTAVFESLIGTNLVPIALAAIVAATVGRRAFALATSASRTPVALVRQSSSRLAEGELTHLERTPVDDALAEQQWDQYVAMLEGAGFRAVEVPIADELPDSVFIEDALVVLGGTAVVTRPGAESRQAETDAVRPVAKRLGLKLREITAPATLDGGDVLVVGTTIYVGRGSRTNAEGIAQFRAIASDLGYTVVAVPVKKVLHLKSAVTALPDGTVIGYPKQVDNPQLFDRFVAMPEPGAAVVVLSADTVLMAASVPKSIAIVEDLGYRVLVVDISEFEKLEGCVTCLSVRVR